MGGDDVHRAGCGDDAGGSAMKTTRRNMIHMLGATAGFAAAATGMKAFGMQVQSEHPRPTIKPATPGASVLVVGGGVAGLCSAFELEQAGYTVTLVEARGRFGGRNFTIRDGSTVPHRSGDQTAAFSKGDYFNAGPARIPGFHRRVLDYCHRFGVDLEPFVFLNQNAFVVHDGIMDGEAIRHRRVRYALAEVTEELMTKSLDTGGLDEILSPGEISQMRDLIHARVMHGHAEERRGFLKSPGAQLEDPEYRSAVPVEDLAKAPELGMSLSSYDRIDWQSTLLQPVGGMDQIPRAFARNITGEKLLATELVALDQDDASVTATLRDRRSGETFTREVDQAVVTVPLPLLDQCDIACSRGFRSAISQGAKTYAKTSKIAWPATRRFWEEDQGIYGGCSIIGGLPVQFWYPSADFGSKTGVVLGAYNFGQYAQRWHEMGREEQAAVSRGFGERMHPTFSSEMGEPVAIDWIDQPYSRGGWGGLADDRSEGGLYATLRKREGRIVLAGDYLSQMSGWQEGAIASAYEALRQMG